MRFQNHVHENIVYYRWLCRSIAAVAAVAAAAVIIIAITILFFFSFFFVWCARFGLARRRNDSWNARIIISFKKLSRHAHHLSLNDMSYYENRVPHAVVDFRARFALDRMRCVTCDRIQHPTALQMLNALIFQKPINIKWYLRFRMTFFLFCY